jgi:transketolase
MSHAEIRNSIELAARLRIKAIQMTHAAKASHIGGCLSQADILAHLFGYWLKVDPKDPQWADRDRFVLSKGHSAAIAYAALAEKGFFPTSWLDDYCKNGSVLGGHYTRNGVPGVELSTGSLGHGLSVGLGMALAQKKDKRPSKTVVLLSDGECDEGSNWEAILLAPQLKLENLVVVVDYNQIQSLGSVKEVCELAPFADKWEAFRWNVQEIDGHDHNALHSALGAIPKAGKPSVVLAKTVKGKGVSFMEGQLSWHYKSADKSEVEKAIAEITRTLEETLKAAS